VKICKFFCRKRCCSKKNDWK